MTTNARATETDQDCAHAVETLHPFFHPRSVAVIGASRHRGTIAAELFHNLMAFGLEGAVLPVNPNASTVQSVAAYADVNEIPGPVDLAVLVVPAGLVAAAARACARKGVRALVVISAGFGETDGPGVERQAELLAICHDSGMRLIGPNCMGILNTDPAVRLNATFVPEPPPPGRIAFMSQSGALGLAIADFANARHLGLSAFVSAGNKADVSGNDLLCYWEQDPNTDVILLYLESFGNPRKFARIARRIARTKPIIAVKSGRTTAGARAAGSHTGAIVAASDRTVDALFHSAGVIRTASLQEMFDLASLLQSQPLPAGRRVAIVTNAGGPGILCADACVAEGLEIPVLAPATQEVLRARLPRSASVQNPVDMIASAPAERYREVIDALAADPNVDAIIAIFVPPLVTRAEDVATQIVAGARSGDRAKPVLAVFLQSREAPVELGDVERRIPSVRFPEEAALALSRAVRHAEWRRAPHTAPRALPGIRRGDAQRIAAEAARRGGGWLTPGEVAELLRCYGLALPAQRLVPAFGEVEQAASAVGGEVALKAIVPGVLHKTDAGLIQLGLSAAQAGIVARELDTRLRSEGRAAEGYLVQRMVPKGLEMLIGVVHDDLFGPVVACGAGGVLVELLADVAVRLAPLSDDDADQMLRELRIHPLLAGFRGGPHYDRGALIDALLRISAMVDDVASIAELDLNPVVVHPHGLAVVDARIRVRAAAPSAAEAPVPRRDVPAGRPVAAASA